MAMNTHVRWYALASSALLIGVWLAFCQDADDSKKQSTNVREIGTPGRRSAASRRDSTRKLLALIASRADSTTRMRAPRAEVGVFSEAAFQSAKAHAYGEWYMRAREQLETCSQPPENPGDMREVRIMLSYQPEPMLPGMHSYIVDNIEFVDEPGRPPVSARQRECLATLRGGRLDIAASFHEIPETHHHLMTSDTMPLP